MEQMYHVITPYRCKLCNQDMLFFVTKNNKLIDYKWFLNNGYTLSETKEELGKRKIKFIKCIYCGKTHIIDWTHGWPEQVTDYNVFKNFGL